MSLIILCTEGVWHEPSQPEPGSSALNYAHAHARKIRLAREYSSIVVMSMSGAAGPGAGGAPRLVDTHTKTVHELIPGAKYLLGEESTDLWWQLQLSAAAWLGARAVRACVRACRCMCRLLCNFALSHYTLSHFSKSEVHVVAINLQPIHVYGLYMYIHVASSLPAIYIVCVGRTCS